MRRFHRCFRCLVFIATFLAAAACGMPPSTSTTLPISRAEPTGTSSVPQATPTMFMQPTTISPTITPVVTELLPSATPVPVEQTTITLESNTWTLPQPKDVAPFAAANSQGVLWVKFPLMVTNENIVRYDMLPIPLGDYEIVYTPLRGGGDNLADGAATVTTLPSIIGDAEVTITGIAQAGTNHFWLRTYALPRGAQNGGLVQVWWIDPQQRTMREIVRISGTGGGRFLTMAANLQWLFWQQSDTTDVSGVPKVKSALIDLETGQSRDVNVGGAIDENSATWSTDSKLYYTQRGQQFAFNPETEQIEAAP